MIFSELIRRFIILSFPMSILLGGVGAISIGGKTPLLLYLDVYTAVVSISLVMSYLIGHFTFTIDKPIFCMALMYVFFGILSSLFNSGDLSNLLLFLKVLLNGMASYFIITSVVKQNDDINFVLISLVLFSSALSAVLVFNFVFNPSSIDLQSKDLIDIGWGKSNYLAAFFAMIIPINVGMLSTSTKRLVRIMYLMLLLVSLIGLLITMSRGAILSVAIALIFLCICMMFNRNSLYNIITLLTVLVIFLAIVLTVIPENIPNILFKLIQSRLESTDYTRVHLLVTALEDFFNNPFLGVGPFETRSLTSRYSIMPHNFVLQHLAELGLFGSLAFFLILGYFLRRSLWNCLQDRNILNFSILASFMSTLIHGMVELTFGGAQYMAVFWILMAIIQLKRLSYRGGYNDYFSWE